MRVNPRKAAFDGLLLVEQGVFISQALNDIVERYQLSDRDLRLATELLYGTTRMRGTLDYYLNKISKRPIERLNREIRNLLRMGAYQIIFLDRIPNSAAVNESVKLVPRNKGKQVAGYINGVLRNLVRGYQQITFPDLTDEPIQHIASKYSYPSWMVKRWVERWGVERTIQLCLINNQVPPIHLRVNTLKITLADLQDYFAEKGIVAIPGKYCPDVLVINQGAAVLSDPWFEQGYYYLQNESSVLVGHAMEPKPGELVYDLCSAPGGKSTHMAQLMDNQGQIIAVDQTEAKVELIRENTRRLGITIINAMVGDASTIKLPLADKVLVDAPCSGLGVLSHRPDTRWSKSLQEIRELSKIQKNILTNASQLVRPGGFLVYSTCTIEPEENQENISWFLNKYPNYRLKALPSWFPGKPETGSVSICSFEYQLDGFFITLLENHGKKEEVHNNCRNIE